MQGPCSNQYGTLKEMSQEFMVDLKSNSLNKGTRMQIRCLKGSTRKNEGPTKHLKKPHAKGKMWWKDQRSTRVKNMKND